MTLKMVELSQIPEQRRNHTDWAISREFCQVIDSLPCYSGVVLEDGSSVNLGFMQSQGYNPVISLDAYIKGACYAILKSKLSNTYVPKGLEEKVKEKMDTLVREEFTHFHPAAYEGPSNKLMIKLAKEDSEK